MPFKYELTWMHHAKRWRKRYLGKTYYMKSPNNGKRDREGYLAALREWERLKAFTDGLGPNPYTATGAIIPESQVLNPSPPYLPPAPIIPQPTAHTTDEPRPRSRFDKPKEPIRPQPLKSPDDPPWILSVGVGAGTYPELVATNGCNPYSGERRIEALAELWLEQRQKKAKRGDLSLQQWADDEIKLRMFRRFLFVNYPTVITIDQIDGSMLSLYRDKQWEFVEATNEHRIGRHTLKKRLGIVSKWFRWLVDENFLTDLPGILRTYGRVKLDKPKPRFWAVDEVKLLASKASERTRLYIMLALNLGYTQIDIATMEAAMIDWETGIVTRDRHKTGVPSQAKLWSSTLALLKEHRSQNRSGPLLLDRNGNPLWAEAVNDKGNLTHNDTIRLAFDRLKRAKKTGLKNNPALSEKSCLWTFWSLQKLAPP